MSQRPDLLERRLRDADAISEGVGIRWVSPRQEDEWAEYRDAGFLRRVGHPELIDALREFWPARGPQWDALGVAGDTVLLVEAKAHVGELASSCSARSEASLKRIAGSLAVARNAFGARADADWLTGYYQLAKAHLGFADRAMPSQVVHVHVDVSELPDRDPA